MSRIDLSTHDLFLRLGSTPTRRSARADELFRRLRNEEQQELVEALRKPPRRLSAQRRSDTAETN